MSRRVLLAAALATLVAPTVVLGQGAGDVSAFCAQTHQTLALRQECVRVEDAARTRVAAKIRALQDVPRETWAHCERVHTSWQVIEFCLDGVEVARQQPAVAPTAETPSAQPTTPMPGAPGAPAGGAAPTAIPPAPSPTGPADATAIPPASSAVPPPAGESSPGVKVWGPEAQPSAAAAEPESPSQPISDEEADRRLDAILERSGVRDAVCTKKQYGTGWVVVCEGGKAE